MEWILSRTLQKSKQIKNTFQSVLYQVKYRMNFSEGQRNSVNWFLLLTYIVILIAITIKTLVLIFVCCFISVVGWTKWCVRKTLCVNFKVRVTCCVGLRRSSSMIKIIQKLWVYCPVLLQDPKTFVTVQIFWARPKVWLHLAFLKKLLCWHKIEFTQWKSSFGVAQNVFDQHNMSIQFWSGIKNLD